MTAEAAVAITTGILASFIALTGFGLDSVIEFFAAAVVIWQLRRPGRRREPRGADHRHLVLRPGGLPDRLGDPRPGRPRPPGHSAPGLAVAAAALVVIPALAAAKRRTGKALGSYTLLADAAETASCAATLLGTGLNALAGWWQADPVAALVIAALAVKEALEVWEHDDEDEG